VLCSPCIPRMLACLLSSFFELPNPHHTSPDPSHDLTDTSCTPTVVDATLARTECYSVSLALSPTGAIPVRASLAPSTRLGTVLHAPGVRVASSTSTSYLPA